MLIITKCILRFVLMLLPNIAQGVEDAETAAMLKAQGCAYEQGCYWSKPLPAIEFVK
ncbi:MAG: EAL domain-containing protein (putative c-di-GMP-specific phosphodiesterase class I) [Patiriisocius sp.]|jgi:EAL domain-containing protein (putative c-di-GMP-specific phosphodiesterase class I)